MDKISELRQKANKLPLLPGVYIMKDAAGEVIYVGKAKALKNRVSSYFSGDHLPKVAAMVSHVNDFDVIVAASEFEALVLENSLIKRHQPHYNILLRDDKTYPFLRLDLREEYPAFSMVNKVKEDGARYFGPFGGRFVTKSILETMNKAMKMPLCGKKFSRDLQKGRPCLNYHMDACAGWCRGIPDGEAYRENIQQMIKILEGGSKALIVELEEEMLKASEELRFEAAAALRDRIRALQELSNRQRVLGSARTDTDAIGFCRGAKTAFVVLHYTEGDLTDKELELMPEPLEEDAAAISALVRQFYAIRGLWPKTILLPCEIEDEEALARLLSEAAGRKVELVTPRRGVRREFLEAAMRNAREESQRAASAAEHRSKTLQWLGQMLGLDKEPEHMEAFDISNTGDFGIVAAMTVFSGGKPQKRAWRRFRMKEVTGQDDFASMKEAVGRRLQRYLDGDEKFAPLPDVLLIDGGEGQVNAAVAAMEEKGLSLPVFGMVKDERHRTRALVDRNGREIGIQAKPTVFSLIGNIQEYTHNYAIEYHRLLRDGRFSSELDKIPGVGPKRREALHKHFKTMKAIRSASPEELAAVLPRNAAQAVFDYYHREEKSMRVITGTARGRKLMEPKDRNIRPTTDMVKEAVFSIVQFDVPGRRVLDLFAGTGQLGIEALSRGAKECVFVDSSLESLSLVRKNLSICGFQGQVVRSDALSYLARGGKFDLVFVDPPYNAGLYDEVLEKAFGFDILNDGGIILVESMRGEELPEAVAPYVRGKQYNYGKVSLTVYTRGTT